MDECKVKSLAKATKVLECFSVKSRELGVSEIAHKLQYQKSTVFNILSTFSDLGYVEQNPETGKYYLSLKILHFGYIVNSHLSYQRIFQGPINQISRETGETCYVGIPYCGKVLYITSADPQSGNGFRAITGETAPMYCTGLGKAMLAFMDEEEQAPFLEETMIKYTDHTIVDKAYLLENLEEIRRNGFAVDNMEHEFGIRCVAVPVFNTDKKVVAAVSVSGPSLRFDPVSVLQKYQTIARIIQPLQYKL